MVAVRVGVVVAVRVAVAVAVRVGVAVAVAVWTGVGVAKAGGATSANTRSSPIEMNAAEPPGTPTSRIASPLVAAKSNVYVTKPGPLPEFGYAGDVCKPATAVHCPAWRTSTPTDVNHPPSEKCMPSWKTRRWNVNVLANV